MEEQSKQLSDYIDAFRRRRLAIGLIAAAVFIIGVIVAFMLPPVYRSSATILIEEQEIPSDLVRSTVTSYATQRIQVISQRVMSRSSLVEVIDKYNLYAADRRRKTTEEIIGRMREDIALDTINAKVMDPRSGRPTSATIAFSLSFEGADPGTVRKIANELTSLYLNENIKTRTEKAAETTSFLTVEAEKLSERITELENKLATFKEQNADSLPSLSDMNLRLINRTELDLMETERLLRSREDRLFHLESELSLINPFNTMVSDSGVRVLDPAARLKLLRAEYATALAKYAPDHPDIKNLEYEIAELEKRNGTVDSSREQAKELARMRSDLLVAKEKYSADHPDVIRLTTTVAILEKQLAKQRAKPPEKRVAEQQPENPAYLAVQSQIATARSDITALRTKRDKLSEKLTDYEKRLAQTPGVEREYRILLRDYNNASKRYQEIKQKQMTAEIGQELEKERKGERFSLIDPAQMPEAPISPNRPAIIFLAFVLSMASGLGYAAAAEALDASIRGAHGVTAILKVAPLSVIPYLMSSADVMRHKKIRQRVIGGVAAGFALVIVLFLILGPPLDVLWFKGLRKFDTIVGG